MMTILLILLVVAAPEVLIFAGISLFALIEHTLGNISAYFARRNRGY